MIKVVHGDCEWILRRRYKHFRKLHDSLWLLRQKAKIPVPTKGYHTHLHFYPVYLVSRRRLIVSFKINFFYSTWSSDEKAVCPSVSPSVKRVHCEKTEEGSVQIFIPYKRSFSLVF